MAPVVRRGAVRGARVVGAVRLCIACTGGSDRAAFRRQCVAGRSVDARLLWLCLYRQHCARVRAGADADAGGRGDCGASGAAPAWFGCSGPVAGRGDIQQLSRGIRGMCRAAVVAGAAQHRRGDWICGVAAGRCVVLAGATPESSRAVRAVRRRRGGGAAGTICCRERVRRVAALCRRCRRTAGGGGAGWLVAGTHCFAHVAMAPRARIVRHGLCRAVDRIAGAGGRVQQHSDRTALCRIRDAVHRATDSDAAAPGVLAGAGDPGSVARRADDSPGNHAAGTCSGGLCWRDVGGRRGAVAARQ